MPEGTPGMPEGTPGMPEGTPGMPEGVPGDMTAAPPLAPSGMEILELTQKISECATRIGNVTEDLAITLDHFNHGRVELQKGIPRVEYTDQEYCTLYHHDDIRSVISGWRDHQASQGFRSVGYHRSLGSGWQPVGGDQHTRSPR